MKYKYRSFTLAVIIDTWDLITAIWFFSYCFIFLLFIFNESLSFLSWLFMIILSIYFIILNISILIILLGYHKDYMSLYNIIFFCSYQFVTKQILFFSSPFNILALSHFVLIYLSLTLPIYHCSKSFIYFFPFHVKEFPSIYLAMQW